MTAHPHKQPFTSKRLYVRWYEKSLALTRLLQWLKHQDTDVQTVLGNWLSRLAKECRDPYAKTERLKNLGADIGLGLLHSQKRRRWYDRVPSLHLGMRRLYILSPMECTYIAGRMLEVKSLLDIYQRIQQEWGFTNDSHMVNQLTTQCLTQGFDTAQDTLLAFERRLFLTCGK